MGEPAVRAAPRARPAAAAQGNGSVRQSAPGGGVRGARRRLEPEARAGCRSRSDDRARIDRRHLFRRAARGRDLGRRQPPRHQHRNLQRSRDRTRRPRRLRIGAKAPRPGVRGRQGQRHGIGRAVARGGAAGARRATIPMSSSSFMYADNCAMQLVRNPKQFDVDRHQQSVRRFAVRLRGDADGLARDAALGLARRARCDRPAQGALRAGARQRPRHRRQGCRQPARLRSSPSR